MPSSENEWLGIASEFETMWNFNHCIGALDGKHVLIKPPAGSGSYYFNYKHTFSIVLLALVDADYKFTYIDVGCNGRVSDGGVFKNSSLFKGIESNTLLIPPAEPLPERVKNVPYVIVADDAFPLKSYLMKPFSGKNLLPQQQIFNYRLSRARRIVENAFGILSNRFRIFSHAIGLQIDKIEDIVLCCCALHNFLRSRQSSRLIYTPPGCLDAEDCDGNIILGNWRNNPQCQTFQSIKRQGSNFMSVEAKSIRQEICHFFVNEGQVAWQNKIAL